MQLCSYAVMQLCSFAVMLPDGNPSLPASRHHAPTLKLHAQA